jgi:hypothetical protein
MTIEEMIQEIDYQATEDIFLDEDNVIDDFSIDDTIEIEYDF